MPVISGGNITQPGKLLQQQILITEASANNAAGTYNGDVVIPGGSFIVDVIVHGVALWNSAGACTLIVGDSDPDGIFTGVDLKATDLLAAEGLSASGGTSLAGGKIGADIANSQWNRRWLATERTIRATVTCAAASGTTGVTRVTVIYTDPASVTNAAFTAS
jgi:hypothetical protein